MNKEDLVFKIKEITAENNGYQSGILGTAWEYAMLCTHRTKKQIELYEEVVGGMASYIQNNKPFVIANVSVNEVAVCAIHSTDWHGKCFKCGQQVFERK